VKKLYVRIFCCALIAIVLITVGIAVDANGRAIDVAILVHTAPADGGTVTPDSGVHHFTLNSEITLVATPSPGYQFIQWLGDVREPAASRTVAYLNKPKIIIALFHQVDYELPDKDTGSVSSRTTGSGSGGGGSFPSAIDFGQPTFSLAVGTDSRPPIISSTPTIIIDPSTWDKDESPEPVEPIEPPIPEPTTAVLLALGILLSLHKLKQNNKNNNSTE
jgi:hypothetical protein